MIQLQAASRHDPLDWLAQAVARQPERLFLATPSGRRLSYSQMDQLANGFAAALAHRDTARGDRVAVQIEKSPEAVALYLACLKLGAVFVPLNTAYTLAELEYFLRDSQPRVAVVQPHQFTAVRTLADGIGLAEVETLGIQGDGSLPELAATAKPIPSQSEISQSGTGDPSALAALLYTSGTTGRSKGAMLSRGNLASNAETLAHAWRFGTNDVLLHALPIFHVHGLFVAINTVLASGASLLFTGKFDPVEILGLLSNATVMMGVPTYYTRLLSLPGLTRSSVRNMRLFVSGSAPLLAETHREFRERTGHAILERYGMSETLMNTSNPYDGERVPGSVGPPLSGISVRIADPESGEPTTEPDAIGMIEVRGPNVFSGYWRMPEKTATEFRSDGYFITGDLGKIDARGYVHIVGRGKDLIITGGYNVYPIEVEAEIDALPGVVESAVIGVPHPDFGEGVTAVVVVKPGVMFDEVAMRRSLEQRLAKFKLPKRILVVEQLPRNTMGKVQKNQLRHSYGQLYQSER